jgi:hypothetical protein
MQKYFRVQEIESSYENTCDTLTNNYGSGFDSSSYEHFMQVYNKTLEQINLPVDFLISVTNQVYMNGDVYMDVLNRAIDEFGQLHIFQVTNNENHKGYEMPAWLLNEFLQSFNEVNQLNFFDNGTILWEYYFEKIRVEEFSHLPSRMQSVFFFENLIDCDSYKKNYLSGIGTTCTIQIEDTTALFIGDMSIIDQINNSVSRDDLFNVIRKYWSGGKTEHPINEVLFQGKYRLSEI